MLRVSFNFELHHRTAGFIFIACTTFRFLVGGCLRGLNCLLRRFNTLTHIGNTSIVKELF